MGWLKNILISMRIKQWAKNVFVFAPLFFNKELFSLETFETLLIAFFLFCFVSSGTYLLNDLVDRKADARDPVKRNRPIASGALPPSTALAVGLLHIFASLIISFLYNPYYFLVLTAYLSLNVLYFLAFKKLAILDVFTVSSLFVIRVISGFIILDIPVPIFLAFTVFFLAQFLLFVKRSFEHAGTEEEKYPTLFLERILLFTAPLLLVCFMLFSLKVEVPRVPLVTIICFALVYLGVERVLFKISGPKKSLQAYDSFILKDPFLLSVMIGFVVLLVLANLIKGAL